MAVIPMKITIYNNDTVVVPTAPRPISNGISAKMKGGIPQILHAPLEMFGILTTIKYLTLWNKRA